jgi:hypothetical protein
MVLVYHGTSVDIGMKAAEEGVLLSRLDVEIQRLARMDKEKFEREFPGLDHETAAWKILSGRLEGIHDHLEQGMLHDREYVFTSMSPENREVRLFAMKQEYSGGGLILGIDVDRKNLRGAGRRSPDLRLFHRKLGIQGPIEGYAWGILRELYLSPHALSIEHSIQEAFQRYDLTSKVVDTLY